MEKKHTEQLRYITRMYGSAEVVQALADITEEESKEYAEGAIIFQNLPVIKRAARELKSLRTLRFAHIHA